jgi:hypothetical protein
MSIVIGLLLALVGVINFMPLMGILGAERLTTMYGYPFEEPSCFVWIDWRFCFL